MTSINKTPKSGCTGFALNVLPTVGALESAIADGGHCKPSECWHFLEIAAIMERLEPGGRHMIRIDAGHVKLNFAGWTYIADTPRHVKRSLMLFDAKRYADIRIRAYRLRLRRVRRVVKASEERKARINSNRIARIAAGSGEQARKYPSLKARVQGFSGMV